MNRIQEFSKLYADTVMNFVPNPDNFSESFRKSAEMGEKMSMIAVKAAQGSVEIANKWAVETLEQAVEVARAKDEAADYAKAAGDFATKSVEAATGHVAGLVEVAKEAQVETAEAVLSSRS